jgi:NADH dehydrogenase
MIERFEELVTVFGGDGFIGRYVCENLFRSGVRVRVASRDPRNSYFIQPLGQVGQFGFVKADITNRDAVRRALEGATAAVNLCGVFGKNMRAIHVDGARNVAEATRDLGLDALVHISAINANKDSESAYAKTKGEGESAVREAFARSTIMRPSLVFGPEDDLTNRFAGMAKLPFLPVIAAKSNFQPVYVRDLGQAIAEAALDPQRYGGNTYEIGGPQVMSMLGLHKAILEITGQTPGVVPLPDLFGSSLSKLGWMPGVPLTRDQWLMLQKGSVPSGDYPGLDDFGIRPTPLGAVGAEWLGRFRGNRFARRIHLTVSN